MAENYAKTATEKYVDEVETKIKSHTESLDIHVTAEKKAEWDGKAAPSDIPNISGKLPFKPLPKFLHALSFDDTYPADAAWLYAQLGPSDLGRCSAVRRGGKLYRKYDWTFDFAAEFVLPVSGNATRFASVGVASVGSRLTENNVMSAVNSRYYKCLPGMTLDGINERGVVAEINVDGGPKNGWHGDAADDGIHILAAVRWVLDHGETAAQAAAYIADHIIQPSGEMNFHFMVADVTSTYIVENGSAHDVTDGVKVLTNYALYDEAHAGGGKERYQLLADGDDISAVNFTNAYQPGNDWDSDFDSAEQHAAAIAQWAAQGADKEAHRGKTTTSGQPWWQSVHTTEYDFAAKTMKVSVQEVDDWYTFSVGGAKVELPSWLTPTREEPPTQAAVAAKYTKPSGGIPATDMTQDVQTSLALVPTAAKQSAWDAKADPSDIPELAAPSESATDAQAAKAKSTYDFVNSSINAMAAFYITKNAAGDSFATKAELTAAIASGTFYNGGQPRVPTKNDYLYILADESHPTAAGTSPTTRYSFDGTQWAFQIVVNDTALTAAQLAAMNSGINAALVSWLSQFKGSDTATTLASVLSAIVGKLDTSKAYNEEHPEYGSSSLRWLENYLGLAFGYVSNGEFYPEIRFTDTPYGEIRHVGNVDPDRPWSWITLGDSTDENTLQDALDSKADQTDVDAKANRTDIAPEYSSSSAYTVGQYVFHNGSIYRCTTAIASPGETWNPAHWSTAQKLDDFFKDSNSLLAATIEAKLPYPLNTDGTIKDRAVNEVTSGAFVIPEGFKDLLIRYTGIPTSLTFSGTDASIADYGDDLPTETGDYLITVTRTNAAECYIRIIKLEARA